MGKAIIMSCDQGRASIQYDRLNGFLDAQIAQFEADLAKIDARIVILEAEILELEDVLEEEADKVKTQIEGYITCGTSYDGYTNIECVNINSTLQLKRADFAACVIAHQGTEEHPGLGGNDPECQAITGEINALAASYQECLGRYGAGSYEAPACKAINKRINAAQKAMAQKSAELYAAKQQRDDIKAEKKVIDAEHIIYLAERNDDLELMDVWVADWTEEDENPAPASVTGTIEVWGMRYASDTCRMPRKKIILRPQYDPALRDYLPNIDYGITGPMNSEPFRVFDMLATFCWVQEHRPQWITARITALSQVTQLASIVRTVPVGLDAIDGVDYGWTADGVTFRYRDCGSRAFRVGDRVIVTFSGANKASPVIIGFEDNPRPCNVNPPIVLWDDTANNYIKLEYLEDLGGGLPGWQRTLMGTAPICGSFQWRKMSNGDLVSCVATGSQLNGSLNKGHIYKNETHLSDPPTGRYCRAAAIHSSGAIVAFCVDGDTSASQVSVWIKQAGTWAQLLARNNVNTQISVSDGPLISQDALTIYAGWTQEDTPEVGLWRITITWGETITGLIEAVTGSCTDNMTYDAGNWNDGYNGADGYKNMSMGAKTRYQHLMLAYSPDDGSVQSVSMESKEEASGTTTGVWTDPPPGSYRFEQEGEAHTAGSVRVAPFGSAMDYGGDSTSHKVFVNPGDGLEELTVAGYTEISGPMADAITSLGIPAPFAAYNGRYVSPHHFGGLLIVQAYQTDGTDTAQGYACLIGAGGQLLGAYEQSSAIWSPLAAQFLTNSNAPLDVYGHEAGEWDDTTASKTARVPYCQALAKNVAETPSGQYVAISGNVSQGVCVISNGNVAELLPEWDQGHTLYLIGFSMGWRGKGIPWPTA